MRGSAAVAGKTVDEGKEQEKLDDPRDQME